MEILRKALVSSLNTSRILWEFKKQIFGFLLLILFFGIIFAAIVIIAGGIVPALMIIVATAILSGVLIIGLYLLN